MIDMKLYCVTAPTTFGVGQQLLLTKEQAILRRRNLTLGALDQATGRTAVTADQPIDFKEGEIIGLPVAGRRLDMEPLQAV